MQGSTGTLASLRFSHPVSDQDELGPIVSVSTGIPSQMKIIKPLEWFMGVRSVLV